MERQREEGRLCDEREEDVLKHAIESFADSVKECLDFYYLSEVPKTATEIEDQCIFLWPKKKKE